MTTAGTHEEVERRLCRGLDRTLPHPHTVVRYSTTAACDFRALWALNETLRVLETEVKTVGQRGRWSDGHEKPLERDHREATERIARIVAPSTTSGDPQFHAPELAYATFTLRTASSGKRAHRVRSTASWAGPVLEDAWVAGGERDP